MTIKERPILFSAPMVKAILAGRKTVTRRIVKPQPPDYINELHGGELSSRAPYQLEWDDTGVIIGHGFQDDNDVMYKVPCNPGERLWVRETWTPDHAAFYPFFPVVYRADAGFDYDRKNGKVFSPEHSTWYPFRWRPSIHMPRRFSRITLEVTDVRVERLQDITEEDAKAEGVKPFQCDDSSSRWIDPFVNLWVRINGEGSFDANPWVWRVEFKRLDEQDSKL